MMKSRKTPGKLNTTAESQHRDPLSLITPNTSAALGRHRVRAAAARVEQHAPVSAIQEETIVALEEGFYKHLAHVDDSALSAASMQNICQECCAIAENQLQKVRKIEAEFYFDLPKIHDQYQKLLEFENALESEVVAWKIILALSTVRNGFIELTLSPQREIEADSEHSFVHQWTKQLSVMCEIQAVVRVLEQCYAGIHPPELSAFVELQKPVPARILLDHEISRLKINPEEIQEKSRVTDEDVFEWIFRALRAGDESFAREIALKHGLVLFLTNFKMRQYSKAVEGVDNAGTLNSRLKWKQIAIMASRDERMGSWQRAVRGILCGNYESALPVAESWEDEAWIYFKCFTDTAVEKAIAQWKSRLGGVGLSTKSWTTSSSVSAIFDQIANSKNQQIRMQAQSIFRLSVRSAMSNDLKDALVEIEKFILATSELYPSHRSDVELRQQNLQIGSGVRFSLHILLLMRRVGILNMDPVLFGRTVYLYLRTTTSCDPELWACYIAKIPDDQRCQAIDQFFTHYLSKSKDKIDFLREVAVRDVDNAVAVAKSFIEQRILSDPPLFTPLDLDIFGGLFLAVGSVMHGMAEWMLMMTNCVIRNFCLQEPMEIDQALDFFLALETFIDPFLQPGAHSVQDDSVKSEFICWGRYFAICDKFSAWNNCADLVLSGSMQDEGVLAKNKCKEEAILAGYEILSTTDWLSEGSTVADDMDQQLAVLRGRTLGQVFSSLINILQSSDASLDEKAEIGQLDTSLDLSEHIMQNFAQKIGNLAFVEDSFDRIQRAADVISAEPAYAKFLTKKLKDKIYFFEQSCKRLRMQLSSDDSILGI